MVVLRQNMSTNGFLKIYQWLKNAQSWLMPSTCVLCHQPGIGDHDLCQTCHNSLPWMPQSCQSCGLPLPATSSHQLSCGFCISRPPQYQRCLSLLRYDAEAPSLISVFKYHGQLQHGRLLATLLASKIQQDYASEALPDLLIPVPLHPQRLRRRGFNQSLELARHLGTRLQLRVLEDVCQRQRHTPPQQGLNAAQRHRNLAGAFLVKEHVLPAGCRVALLDDVITTGTTVGEISRQLLLQGASEVHAWCVARAVKGGSGRGLLRHGRSSSPIIPRR
jgi:ComF family protein